MGLGRWGLRVDLRVRIAVAGVRVASVGESGGVVGGLDGGG